MSEHDEQAYAGDIDPQAAWDMLAADPAAVLVDCRTEAEWAFVGVPDVSELGKQAVLVPGNVFQGGLNETFVEDLRAAGVDGGPLVFLCRSGQRSIGAATVATAAGLGPAYNITEGFEGAVGPEGHRDVEGWKVRGLPWRQG